MMVTMNAAYSIELGVFKSEEHVRSSACNTSEQAHESDWKAAPIRFASRLPKSCRPSAASRGKRCMVRPRNGRPTSFLIFFWHTLYRMVRRSPLFRTERV
jgi:hypothetical protein